MTLDAGGYVNIASGILFALLGAWTMSLKPRRRTNVAFGLFTILYGLMFVPSNLATAGVAQDPSSVATGVLALASAGVLAWLAVTFPRPLAREERRLLVLPVVVGVAVAGVTTGVVAHWWLTARGPESSALKTFAVLCAFLLHGTIAAALVLFPLRYRALPAEESAGRLAYAFFAAALVCYFGFTVGAGNGASSSIFDALDAGGASGFRTGINVVAWGAVIPLVVVLWLWNAQTRADSAVARNVALFSLALPLVGLLSAAFDIPGGHGASRMVAIAILAVAILRRQILDVDVKLRFTISRGTIAAAFIAAFFLASEGAQIIFGQESEWIGLFAAGALVFALAPLQRAAERLAERAVPVEERRVHVSGPQDGSPLTSAEAAYVAALRAAVRDGVLTRREERHLAEVAEHLGIGPKRALELRERVESEVAA